MKRLVSILAFLSAALVCTGQKINKAEYFIDTDPGFGKAINIPISAPANDVSLSYSVNISSLSQGFHMLVYRARDDKGHWSVGLRQVFYVFRSQGTTDSRITRAEYFIDTDPGFGSAVNIPIATPADKLELSFNVNLSALSQGFHLLVIRTRDYTGRWSLAFERVFFVYRSQSDAAAQITKAEYFIDTDPGFGSAVSVPIATPANKLELSFNVDINSLDQGFHIIVLRTRDNTGRWSPASQQVFYVFKAVPATTTNVTAIEYFLDNDPGFGKGTIYNIPAPASKVVAEFTANLTGVTNGSHVLYLRAKDASGKWSHLYSQSFTVTTTGIGDIEAMSWFKLYPNPSTGKFIIEFADLESSTVELTINDMNGRQVYSNKLSGENISVSVDIPSGIYMITVKAGDKSFKQKLLINR
jgi:hypothetical protein